LQTLWCLRGDPDIYRQSAERAQRIAGCYVEQKKTPGSLRSGRAPNEIVYADFFNSVGNAMIFPRCSGGIHFTFCLNLAGM
jgi:hypothetical protein